MESYLCENSSSLNVFLGFHFTKNKFAYVTLNKEIENNTIAMFMKGIC